MSSKVQLFIEVRSSRVKSNCFYCTTGNRTSVRRHSHWHKYQYMSQCVLLIWMNTLSVLQMFTPLLLVILYVAVDIKIASYLSYLSYW